MSEDALDASRGIPAEVQASVQPRLSWDASLGPVPVALGWEPEPCVVDWQDEGQPDLLVSSGGGDRVRSSRLYRPLKPAGRDGTPVYDAGRHIPSLDGLRCLCPLPSDRHGLFDLVGIGHDGLLHLPNQGTAEAPAFGPRIPLGLGPDLGLGPCHVVQMVAIDWNQDGLDDLLIGINDLTGYWPDSDRLPLTQHVGFNHLAGHPGYDRAGLWRGRTPVGRIFWLRNLGRRGEPRFEPQPEIKGEKSPLDIGLHPAPLALAWGGRGSTELLVSDDRGLLRVYRNFGGQLPPVLMEPRTLHCGRGPLPLPDDRIAMIASDIDKDGSPELIYGTSDGRLFAVHAGPSRNEARTPVPILHHAERLELGGHAAIAAFDLDADGDLDIVYGDPAGRLHMLEDLGSGDDHRYARPVELEAGGAAFRLEPGPDGMLIGPAGHRLGFARPAPSDWLDHGRPDLIVTGAGGDVLLLSNDGADKMPRFGHPLVMRSGAGPLLLPPRIRPWVGSWTDPENLDLIGLDLQGMLVSYTRIDRGEVGPPEPIVDHLGRMIRLDGGFGLSGGCSIWAGAWTRARTVDLIIGLPRSNRHVIPAATGEPLEDLDSVPTILLLENQGDGTVVPRPLRFHDGRPVVVGQSGCFPQGVSREGQALPDLLVGNDDGTLTWIAREALGW